MNNTSITKLNADLKQETFVPREPEANFLLSGNIYSVTICGRTFLRMQVAFIAMLGIFMTRDNNQINSHFFHWFACALYCIVLKKTSSLHCKNM